MTWFVLLVAALHIAQVSSSIPDKSLLWSSRNTSISFNPEASDWTNAQITSGEFSKTFQHITIQSSNIYGMAVDARKKHLLFVDKAHRSIGMINVDKYNSAFFHMGTSPDIGQLTIDWRGRNVYWTDTGYGWIAMKKLPQTVNQHDSRDHRFKVIVDKYLQRPTGIAVHPHKFYLFWADKGGQPQIERSDLTGAQRTILIWQGMISPTTLCIDNSTERLYWSDPARGTVEYSDLDGNGRTILISDPNFNYFGIALFQDALVYTVPVDNRTGYVSLRANNEGDHLQAVLQIKDTTLYHVLTYDTDQQPRENNEGCDSNHPSIVCQQICLHMPQDQGRTCLCNDGYDLILNQNCSADEKILQRHIMFTKHNDICAMPISVLGFGADALNQTICGLVTSVKPIKRFSLDMANKVIFFTDGSSIYKQSAFKPNETTLYNTTSSVIDMDYDWKKRTLYWIQSDDGHLYYTNVDTQGAIESIDLEKGNAVSIAVDPYNGQIFLVALLPDSTYRLNKWSIRTNKTIEVPTTLLSFPTDLEYDRIKNRLLWNDNFGYIGMINVDSTGEIKYDIQQTTGKSRLAVTTYKNYILSTSKENRQFEVIYELDSHQFRITLSTDIEPIQDIHVYESSLQPSDLEPCEKENNGGCGHICVPNQDVLQCKCLLGYILAPDDKSCVAEVLETNYYVALDSKHGMLYQIDRTTQIAHAIEIDEHNAPSSMTLDSTRRTIVWVDNNHGVVKKKELGKNGEIAIKTGVDTDAAVAVDVSTGNVFVSTDTDIIVINSEKDSVTVVDSAVIQGTVGNITLQPQTGRMAWFERGVVTRIMLAYMDGSKPEVVLDEQDMMKPEDLAFDLIDDNWLYWCDSDGDTVSRIDLTSFANTAIYQGGRDLNPVAIDIVGSYIYLVPRNQRKIVRLNKNTGLGQKDVFESPLFGTFTNFYLFRDDIKGHALCGQCNGGCSNLCLPTGSTRRCACADGVALQTDGVTCTRAAVCKEDSYANIEGLESLSSCCSTSVLHHAVCATKCLPGYEGTHTHVACKAGAWNATLNGLCQEKAESLPVVYIAAGAGGGAVVIIIVIGIVCVCRKKKGEDKFDSRRLTESTYTDANSPYASPDTGRSPDPPPRQEEIQEEEYNYLDEALMVDASKLTVDLSQRRHGVDKPKEKRYYKDRKNTYSTFPEVNNGYITPSELPHPPTPDVGSNTDDGYLAFKSISGGSIQENISGGSFDEITIRYDGNRNNSDGSVPLSVQYLPQNGTADRQPPSAHLGGFHGKYSGGYPSEGFRGSNSGGYPSEGFRGSNSGGYPSEGFRGSNSGGYPSEGFRGSNSGGYPSEGFRGSNSRGHRSGSEHGSESSWQGNISRFSGGYTGHV